MRWLACLLLVAGCASQDDRECVDFKSVAMEREKCIPLYGALLCATEIVTDLVCVRYEEAASLPDS